MPYQPVNFGNAMIQGENILNARHSRDPNSLQNQLLAAKIADLQNTGPDLFGGVPKPTSQMKNDVYRTQLIKDIKAGVRPEEDLARFEEWVRASQYREIMNVPTQFSGGQPGKPLSTLGDEGAADAYIANMKQSGTQAAQAGQRYDAPIAQGDINLGVRSSAPVAVPSEASLAASKRASVIAAEDKAKRKLPDAAEKREEEGFEARNAIDLIDSLTTGEKPRLSKAYGKENRAFPDMAKPQEWLDAEAERDQIVSMLQLAAAGKLKGQGQITENERVMLARAATVLGNPLISVELASREMKRVRAYFARVDARKAKGGQSGVDDFGAMTEEQLKAILNE